MAWRRNSRRPDRGFGSADGYAATLSRVEVARLANLAFSARVAELVAAGLTTIDAVRRADAEFGTVGGPS
jgi:hypothetical protein